MNLEEFRTKLFGMSGLATVEKAFELYSELEAENERLKGEIKVLHTECDTCWKVEELRKEIAKLKCLALHAMIGYAANEYNYYSERIGYEAIKRCKIWKAKIEEYREAYRKAKAKLKEKKK